MRHSFLIIFILIYSFTGAVGQEKFTNPILESGPDPWVIKRGEWYYFMCTTGNSLAIRKTKDLTELSQAEKHIVFSPPDSGMYSRNLWAPELHFIRNKWYIYFAADDGKNKNHRIYVLENENADPTTGNWILKGKLRDAGDHWAIDLTIIEIKDRLFAAWSGWDGFENGMQRIYIAELSDPWTMQGRRVEISRPRFPWERHGAVPEDWQKNGEVPEVLVNEGPEFLVHGNKIFIVFSANACWLDYCLGLLETDINSDLLDSTVWKKYPDPVFRQSVKNNVFAPGHNGFFKSPDGKEDWIIFHANAKVNDGCGNKRAPYIQRFYWKKNGYPDFGEPMVRKALSKPGMSFSMINAPGENQ